ncbi:hypothetical protein ABIE41_000163 [Bosea sp. OAE506]|uniref:hypothetical protein n=1 Tax=Bosea sp. OAE506 TaxID=2663870 RepID=UPI001788EEE5
MEKPVKSFTVQMDIERSVTVVVEAGDEAEARPKANDLDFNFEAAGEIKRWVVHDVAELPQRAAP